MAQDGAISDIRFKLNEASYFFEQMKKNTDNSEYSIYNLNAFMSAARSLLFTIRRRFKKWYDKEMKADLEEKHEDFQFFNSTQFEFSQEGNLRKEIFVTVSKTFIGLYNIESETGNDNESKVRGSNSVHESPIIAYNPAAEKESEKYDWRFRNFKSRSVILSCEEYLHKLSIVVEQCEKYNPVTPKK